MCIVTNYLMGINFNQISKRFLVYLVVVIGIIAVGILFWFNQTETHEFAGSVETIEGNTIFATGFFSKNGKPISDKENQKESIEISVDSNTKLTRLVLKIPQGVTMFHINDLEKEESLTDLETIKNDSLRGHVLGIEAVLKKDHSDRKFIGRTLYFRVPVFSE